MKSLREQKKWKYKWKHMLKIRNFILTVKQFQWERAEVNPFCVYVSDLARFITDSLDLLTWHNINNVIPEDQIWLKVGGYHGGGSFKTPLQTACNHQTPDTTHSWIIWLNQKTVGMHHWARGGEHGQSRKKINSYSSSCVNTTLRSLQHSGITWQPVTCSQWLTWQWLCNMLCITV